MATHRAIDRREFLGRALTTGAAGLVSLGTAARPAHAAAEGLWQIGCYTRPWDKHHWCVALDAIAEAGFKHAGLMTTTSEQRRLVISVDTTPEEARKNVQAVADGVA